MFSLIRAYLNRSLCPPVHNQRALLTHMQIEISSRVRLHQPSSGCRDPIWKILFAMCSRNNGQHAWLVLMRALQEHLYRRTRSASSSKVDDFRFSNFSQIFANLYLALKWSHKKTLHMKSVQFSTDRKNPSLKIVFFILQLQKRNLKILRLRF